jgi:hypothetical protein
MNDVIDLPEATTLPAINNPTPSYLLQMAVQQGADLDKLERLMALQERWEANEARKAYDTAFAAFKAQAVVIVKNRKVTAGPLAGKSYAELFSVVNAVTPALSAHGLSSSWKITKDEPQWLEVTCTIKHVAGHTESVSMGGPPDVGGAKNAIQARASTVSYLERYTLKAITGLSEQDDDDNGGRAGPEPRGNDDLDKLIQDGRQTAMDGMKALTAWYNRLTATQKSEVNPAFGQMRAAARMADQGSQQ